MNMSMDVDMDIWTQTWAGHGHGHGVSDCQNVNNLTKFHKSHQNIEIITIRPVKRELQKFVYNVFRLPTITPPTPVRASPAR